MDAPCRAPGRAEMLRLALQQTLLRAWDNAPLVFLVNFVLVGVGFAYFLVSGVLAEAAVPLSTVVPVWLFLVVGLSLFCCGVRLLAEARLVALNRSECLWIMAGAAMLTLAVCAVGAALWGLIDPAQPGGTPLGGALRVVSLWASLTGLLLVLTFLAAILGLKQRPSEAAETAVGIVLGSPATALGAMAVLVLLFVSSAILLPGPFGIWLFSLHLAAARTAEAGGADLAIERKSLEGMGLRAVLQPWRR